MSNGNGKPDTAMWVNLKTLTEMLWAANSRPAPRTIRSWQKRRIIPYYKAGNKVWYDPDEVRRALLKRNLIRSL